MTFLLFLLSLLVVSPAWGITYTETWTHANADAIDADNAWDDDPFTKGGDLDILSNKVGNESTTATTDVPRLTATMDTTRVCVQADVTVGVAASGNQRMGPALWMNASTTESFCGCVLRETTAGGADDLVMISVSSGTNTNVTTTGVTYTPGTTKTVKACVDPGTAVVTCIFDPDGANQAINTGACGVAATTSVGFVTRSETGEAAHSVEIDNWTASDVPGRRHAVVVD